MLDILLSDNGYLAADLLTGKSLPLLCAIASLPLDLWLLSTVVAMGVACGSCLTLLQTWRPPEPGPLAWATRVLAHFFAAFLNVSLLLHLGRELAGHGVALIPAYCVVMQSLPEAPSTLVVLGLLSFTLFYLSVYETATLEPEPAPVRSPAARELQSLGEVVQSLWRSLLMCALAAYASAVHGPVKGRYLSPEFRNRPAYAVVACTMAGLTRFYTYMAAAFASDRALLGLLAGEPPAHDGLTPWVYVIALTYSASWSCTQLAEQGLAALPWDKTDARARVTALIFGLAYVCRWNRWGGVWLGTLGVLGATVASLCATTLGG